MEAGFGAGAVFSLMAGPCAAGALFFGAGPNRGKQAESDEKRQMEADDDLVLESWRPPSAYELQAQF